MPSLHPVTDPASLVETWLQQLWNKLTAFKARRRLNVWTTDLAPDFEWCYNEEQVRAEVGELLADLARQQTAQSETDPTQAPQSCGCHRAIAASRARRERSSGLRDQPK